MKSARPLLAVLLFAAPFPGAHAQSSVEERLKALESKVELLLVENARLRQELGREPLSPPPAPVAVQPGGREARLSVGGFLQAQAEFGRAADPRWAGVSDRFFFRRARVHVAGSFAEDFDFKAELDLQGNTLGAATGHRAQANEVYVNWRKYPGANVRFGQLKPAFGGEQLMSDTRLVTVERSLGSDRLADGRQLAVSVLGDLADRKVSYLVVAANGNGPNVSANDNSKFQQSARVVYTPVADPDRRLALGANGFRSEDAAVSRPGLGFTGNTFAGRREGVGLDAHATFGRADFGGEWLRMTYRPANAAPDAKFDASAWHLTAGFFVLPARLQAVVRRESFDPNSRRGGDVIDSWLFGLNYLIRGDDLKLQLNYLRGDVPGSAADGGRLLTRLQVVF